MPTHLSEDIATVFARDPAARSRAEVLLCYPGVKALYWHRIAHRLYLHRHTLLARWISARTRRKTGIEIHPAHRLAAVCSSTTARAWSLAKPPRWATT